MNSSDRPVARVRGLAVRTWGAGEPLVLLHGGMGTVGGTPTVINAVLDALRPLGVKHLEMPATSERVWRAMQEAKAA